MALYIYTHNKYTQNMHIMQTKNILDAINQMTALINIK